MESFISKRSTDENILAIAEIYENIEEFYIPTKIDYRGRIYCNVPYLNYQSTELAKALLLFSKGEEINLSDTNSINFLPLKFLGLTVTVIN